MKCIKLIASYVHRTEIKVERMVTHSSADSKLCIFLDFKVGISIYQICISVEFESNTFPSFLVAMPGLVALLINDRN